MLVRYTYQNASGATVEKPSEEFSQTVYDYGYAPIDSQEFHEGDRVNVSTYEGKISSVYRMDATDSHLEPPAVRPLYDQANGQILKVLGMSGALRLQLDANRFYVKQGTGYPLEKRIRETVIYANIRVGSDGKTVLESLDDNGTILR